MGPEKRWLFTLFSSAFLSLLFLLVYSISAFSSSKQFPSIIHHGTHYPPAFAYYISGGRGDKDRILRLLLAVYHPRNRYLLHLGAEASDEERMRLVGAVNAVPAIRSFGNVDVIGMPSRLTYMGSSNLAAMLRAAAILLRMDAGWTWFVSLSATDYPLITQDGVGGVAAWQSTLLSRLKKSQRIQPIVVDPGIYLARRSQIFHATEKRPTPDGFKSVYWATPLAGYDIVCRSGRVEGKQVNSLGGFSELRPVMELVNCASIRGSPPLGCNRHALVCSICSLALFKSCNGSSFTKFVFSLYLNMYWQMARKD
ncbi:hypothetical protein NC653_021165 [Populus alba x Populus x berolinensis]|uniref:Uncharacterized protein n=1 Tax=Populus alba x Populus x berolinensis TaxID=444605 RepID=A0AAD6MMA4_9ROSI|nr:hypothetical protein NC653_021165 [Populus alba x Populus x berolinensis]